MCRSRFRAFYRFGGWQRSLSGEHRSDGKEGIHFYTRLRIITSKWPEKAVEGAEFNMPTLK